jgi:hypothetical protein
LLQIAQVDGLIQIQYALRLMKPVIDGLAASFEVRDEDTDAYNERLDRWSANSVTRDCTSYYRWHRTGRNFAFFPGPLMLLYWLTRNVRWERYKVVNGEKWKSQRRSLKWKNKAKAILVTMLVGVLARGLLKRNTSLIPLSLNRLLAAFT